LGKGVPLEQGCQREVPPKRCYFAVNISYSVKTVACTDMLLIITSTGDRLFRFINIDDLERPWTPQKGAFSKYFAIFGCSAHFNTELRRNGWR